MLIDGKSFFDLPVKNEEAYEKIIEMSRSNDNASGNLLDFTYFKENYRLNAIDLSQQNKLKDPQQIKISGKLEEQNNGATIFSSSKNQKKLLWSFTKLFEHHIKIETRKISNLLSSSENEFSKFATRKWYVIDSESNARYSNHDPTKFLTK